MRPAVAIRYTGPEAERLGAARSPTGRREGRCGRYHPEPIRSMRSLQFTFEMLTASRLKEGGCTLEDLSVIARIVGRKGRKEYLDGAMDDLRGWFLKIGATPTKITA